jgi:hypothetical protein
MRVVVALEVGRHEASVNLGGLELGVAEHAGDILYGGAVANQIGGEGMA